MIAYLPNRIACVVLAEGSLTRRWSTPGIAQPVPLFRAPADGLLEPLGKLLGDDPNVGAQVLLLASHDDRLVDYGTLPTLPESPQ